MDAELTAQVLELLDSLGTIGLLVFLYVQCRSDRQHYMSRWENSVEERIEDLKEVAK